MISNGGYSEFSKKVKLFRKSDQDILYVIGNFGVGKTSAALEYVKENASNNDILYSALALPSTLKKFGINLLSNLSITFQKQMNADQIIQLVVIALKTHGIRCCL
ncbi:hypothetical protein [Paenibacillus qinlingensis]|nr:hypothetical protein [Paenibacillus qinlingensis]